MHTKWIRSDEIVWEDWPNGAVLVSPASGKRWSLNATAAKIWSSCDGSATAATLACEIATATGGCFNAASRELDDFCRTIAQLGILHPSGTLSSAQPLSIGVAPRSGFLISPEIRELGVGASAGRRPSPRGNSGPG